MAALLLMFSYAGFAQVESGTTYSTPSISDLPEGWSGEDGGGTSYVKLIDATHYIQTADFEQNGFSSIVIKARKFGGPSEAQAKITVSWYDSEEEETVLGTIDPTSTTLTNYTISNPATTENGTGYIKIQNKNASSSKGSGVSEVTITYVQPGGTQPTTYTVTYDCNGGTSGCPNPSTLTVDAGSQIELADAPSKDGFDFAGWSDGTTIYGENADYTVNGNVTFTAQWTEQSSDDVQWVLTSLTDLTENDVFVIVGNNGSNYAMSNNNGTNSAPSAVAVTVENGVITSAVASIRMVQLRLGCIAPLRTMVCVWEQMKPTLSKWKPVRAIWYIREHPAILVFILLMEHPLHKTGDAIPLSTTTLPTKPSLSIRK